MIPYGFKAYITIIKNNPIVFDFICPHFPGTAWISALVADPDNDSISYPKNAKCQMKETIQPNNQYWVTPGLFLERHCDIVKYYFNDDSDNFVALDPEYGEVFILQAPEKEALNITWIFLSDGSVQDMGFFITFNQIGLLILKNLLCIKCNGFNFVFQNVNVIIQW